MVSRLASIRVLSAMRPLSSGTLKSQRTRTFLPSSLRLLTGVAGIVRDYVRGTGKQPSAAPAVRNTVIFTLLDVRRDERGHIGQPIRVTPFVVVPRKDLHQPLIQHLGQRCIEDRRMRIVIEID